MQKSKGDDVALLMEYQPKSDGWMRGRRLAIPPSGFSGTARVRGMIPDSGLHPPHHQGAETSGAHAHP